MISDTQRIVGDGIDSQGIIGDVIVIQYSTDGDTIDSRYSTIVQIDISNSRGIAGDMIVIQYSSDGDVIVIRYSTNQRRD